MAFPPSVIGLPDAGGDENRGLDLAPNPFDLPEDDRAEVVLIEGHWYQLAAGRHPDLIESVLDSLARRADVLIGLEGNPFALGFPPTILERLALVIEFDGLYRDRELYNYLVGPQQPGANWTEKLRPRSERYRTTDLEKLRLSVPFFATDLPPIRRAARARAGGGPRSWAGRIGRDLGEAALFHGLGVAGRLGRPFDVHCLCAPTHRQRIEAVELLAGLSGAQGLIVVGGPVQGSPADSDPALRHYREWIEESRAVREAAEPYAREPMSRLRYLLGLRRHKVAVAPTGYGELTYRHGEALRCGAALVCQDLSHVEMMFPFRDRENVVYCRPDLSDLRSTVEELLADDRLRERIARRGRRAYVGWARRWREHLHDGIERHIREALSSA